MTDESDGGLVRFLAPEFGDGEFDFSARRRRSGPILAAGLALYAIRSPAKLMLVFPF